MGTADAYRVGPHGYIHGWIKAGAPGGAAATIEAAQKHVASLKGKISPRELNDYDVGDFKRDTLNPAFRYSPTQERAIRLYTGRDFKDINGAARAGLGGGDIGRTISSAMQPMPEDLVLLREIKGMHVLDHVNPGDVVSDDGFSSTTLKPGRFAGGASDTTVMHILTPKGTPVVWANPASEYPEDEVILDHGQPMVVMAKRPRPGRVDVTDVFVLVLPKGSPS